MAVNGHDEAVREYVFKTLNLDEVRAVVSENNPGWDAGLLRDAETWYRNFLWVAYRMSGQPDQVVGIEPHADQFWHAHILYTQDYADTCRRILGKDGFLHHNPMRSAKGLNAKVAEDSQAAYENFRGELETESLTILIQIGPFDIPCFWNIIFGAL